MNKERENTEKIEGYVWCAIHCCIHEDNDDPYDYGYAQTGEEPECGERDWRKLWIGASLSESNAEISGGIPYAESNC